MRALRELFTTLALQSLAETSESATSSAVPWDRARARCSHLSRACARQRVRRRTEISAPEQNLIQSTRSIRTRIAAFLSTKAPHRGGSHATPSIPTKNTARAAHACPLHSTKV